MNASFNQQNFHSLCDDLASRDASFNSIISAFGYPPFWGRPNTFESLVHIILEQQVSLASAWSALQKLKNRTGQITPETLLALSDEELKACYFSRQKTVYAKHLAENLLYGVLNLQQLEHLKDEEVRSKLTAIKGIGNWTTDIYLIFVLHRTDIFPIGDLAVVNALKRLKNLPTNTPKERLLQIAEAWKPFRTIATMLLWHEYLSRRKIK
ncbi:DNA-3-methyladenine glycosylase family protein [Mucilaginibacter arboris]|uniref:DNA-3-methyladenine glycosylase II n=1 Tax=Mucilaginibacter arboris TaxID=2682090 RepID=A0A7K1SVH7_9SPHI|nr:DNA-3-methyladenine glycosylase 2 family protein [Mucilaginibacter arboris]MVN21359.1 DNA-3-methyladenine glycosylase 2 family protein [Mucilaginibacter arboris]